ncbi:integral membrane protein [Moniliophthora roreri MCA 2997]|uniref:Integral membrane protein n=1 Tax=Moniliophthora roreri (strain MCA 2997) TaxID=1381753 RepID=V2W8Q5_MONRO|nr:integral membrane protein [Moniliophthora roreri MCA 2997]
MYLSLFTVFVSALLLVGAQDVSTPTSPPGTSCVVQCSMQALPAGPCNAITDLQCICTNEVYQQALRDCLSANCNAEDMQTAMNLQQQNCGPLSAPSGSPSAPAPSGPPATTGEQPTAPSSPPPSSAPAPTGGSTTVPKPTTGTSIQPAASSTAIPGTSVTGNAAQGQATLLFTQDVLVAFGMVWAGMLLGVLLV